MDNAGNSAATKQVLEESAKNIDTLAKDYAKTIVEPATRNFEEVVETIIKLVPESAKKDFALKVKRDAIEFSIRLKQSLLKSTNSLLPTTSQQSSQKDELKQYINEELAGLVKAQSCLEVEYPVSLEEYETALRWFYEKGTKHDLPLLNRIEKNPPYHSELLKLVKQRIVEGRYLVTQDTSYFTEENLTHTSIPQNMKGLYRIFAPVSAIAELPPGVIITKYGVPDAFTIVTAPAIAIPTLRKSFVVETLRATLPELAKSAIPKPLTSTPAKDIPTLLEGVTMRQEHVIRFDMPVMDEWIRKITNTGAKFLQAIGIRSFVVEVPDQHIAQELKKFIDEFEGLAQVERYQPEIAFDREKFLRFLDYLHDQSKRLPELDEPDALTAGVPLPGLLSATFFTAEDCQDAVRQFEPRDMLRGEVSLSDKTITLSLVNSETPAEDLARIENLAGLQRLEQEYLDVLCNNVARNILLAGEPAAMPQLPWAGAGEIIAISDTGLDTGEASSLHPDLQGRVEGIKSYKIDDRYRDFFENPGDDKGPADTFSGHGTHVAGSALGSGKMSKPLKPSKHIQGTAPEARLFFQALEQSRRLKNQFSDLHDWFPVASLYGKPKHLKRLFEDSYAAGARIHSLSFSNSGKNDDSQSLDEFVWQHKDFLVVVAAGNAGRPDPDIAAIAPNSISAPATAKNCLTVGACENHRPHAAVKYGTHFTGFKDKPFYQDPVADSVDDIAAFSSRGPCLDGRRKPDVVAPGTLILSTRSSQIPYTNFIHGLHPTTERHQYAYMSGTSMSAPLIAGCAAVVRQYLREEKGITNPSAAMVKAVIIHSAEYINYCYAHPDSKPWADNEQGWGRVNLANCLQPEDNKKVFFFDESATETWPGLSLKEKKSYDFYARSATSRLRATLVYTDAPGKELVNNLNLRLVSPNGTNYVGNDFARKGEPDNTNNVEGVIVEKPETGLWKVQVDCSDKIAGRYQTNKSPQDFALVLSGDIDD